MTRFFRTSLSFPALLVLLLAPAGCGDKDGSGEECTSLICPCTSNDDCASGQVCTALGLCGLEDATDVTAPDTGLPDVQDDADQPDVAVPDVADGESDVGDVGGDDVEDDATDVLVDADVVTPDAEDAADVVDMDTADTEDATDVGGDTDVEDPDGAEDVEADTGPVDPFPVVVPPADNPWVAFARQPTSVLLEQIYITPLEGGEALQLFSSTDYLSSFSPTWSPDGTRLAFVAFTLSTQRELVVVDVTTGQSQAFSLAPLTDFGNLSWAPVGGQIALNGRAGSDDNEIYLFDVDAETPALVPLTDNSVADTFPRWINDGRVAYVSEADGGIEVFAIDTLTDGASPIQLSTGTGMRGAFGIDPTGELLFYSVSSGDAVTALRRNNLTTGQLQTFDSSPSEGDAYVRRDGEGLVFGSGRSGTVQLYHADLAVSAPVAITASTLRPSTPCVSPVSGGDVAISGSFSAE